MCQCIITAQVVNKEIKKLRYVGRTHTRVITDHHITVYQQTLGGLSIPSLFLKT